MSSVKIHFSGTLIIIIIRKSNFTVCNDDTLKSKTCEIWILDVLLKCIKNYYNVKTNKNTT